jgi:hypothetical protein
MRVGPARGDGKAPAELFADHVALGWHCGLPEFTRIVHRRSLRAAGDRKNRDTPKASRLLFASRESYLLSFGASLFMLSSDFVVFLELFFFFILALAFIGLSVFMESCAAGAVV